MTMMTDVVTKRDFKSIFAFRYNDWFYLHVTHAHMQANTHTHTLACLLDTQTYSLCLDGDTISANVCMKIALPVSIP